MRDDYLQAARKVIEEPNVLVNTISNRVKQLRRGSRPLVESLEKLSLEDIALREVAEGKISYELAVFIPSDDPARFNGREMPVREQVRSPIVEIKARE